MKQKQSITDKIKGAAIIWLAIYPLVTALSYFPGMYLHALPLAFRTLIMTLIAVPIMFFILVPFLNKVFARSTH